MKVLITGGKGLLGTSIVPVLRAHFDCAVYDIDEWDITSEDAGKKMFDLHRPDVLVNLAAMTDVDGCEDKTALAEKSNGEGPAVLAGLCTASQVKLVHISTDYVFDGEKNSPYTEDDEPHPQSVYGRTKLAGERKILERNINSAIIRTEWLYGRSGTSFVDKIVAIAKAQGHARVVNDQRGSPTYARDLALPVAKIIEKGLTGIYHVSNSGSCTWYDFAKAIFSILRMNVEVVPISSADLGSKAKRPSYSVFDLSKLRRDTGIEMRNWMDALDDYLANAP
ncbi:MAG: rfbD [Deltaproteobacteria bacterium]|nr:rfbD [Deltaproteobacteria bacterium]